MQVGAFSDYTEESGGGDDGGNGGGDDDDGASEAAAGDAEADQVRLCKGCAVQAFLTLTAFISFCW